MLGWLYNLLPGRKAEPTPVPTPQPKPVTEVKDIFYVYRPILDLLGKSEGTDKGRGYNETLGYGAYTGGNKNLVGMTLGEIDVLQTSMLAHKANKWNSSALGRYQVVRATLRRVKKELGLSDKVKFDVNLQDTIALHLLEGRKLTGYLSGAVKEDTFLTNLAREWASIPTPNGTGFYGNQSKTPVTPKQVRAVLAEVKQRVHSK